ncbi:sensor histidine kinase [Chitinibacter sp. GC72]|uniref:sensor histidine kinase n=1 Tax=Chitinibacter sp. GC72 TaxID=1526917 RepID=UPI0012FB5E49|nr:histidine kinase [Chitinibacter sp. GC72]
MALFFSTKQFPNFNWQREIGLLLLVNTIIAVALSVIEGATSFGQNLLISHCIGFSIGSTNCLLHLGVPSIGWNWRSIMSVIMGVPLGFTVAHWLGAPNVFTMMQQNPDHQWRGFAFAMIVSFVACAFFIVFYRSLTYKHELEKAKRQHAEARQAEISAQLAMLQAQIEPHFLFNTLANVHSLITRDAPLAQTMLEHLNDYLRASLSRTRQAQTSLADEIELVRALLAISQIRLGARLTYEINIPPALLHAQLPPLLLQPLVENALEHGIEPAIEGGHILIEALQLEASGTDTLLLRVSDTGLGLNNAGSGGHGVGLANVRARLQSLYGERGQLLLSSQTMSSARTASQSGHGVIAELRLPLNLLGKASS